jgi:DNA-binding MarR family transcriptional regulator
MAASSQGAGQAQSFSSPQEEALLNLMRSADCVHRSMQHRLKPSGLTLTQFNVLRILRGARPAGLTCSTIGHMMITPEPDITRLLGRLKTRRLLRQQRDQHDRRVVWTYITTDGLEELAKLDGLVEQAPRELFAELTQVEIQALTRLLKKASLCGSGKRRAESDLPATVKPPSPRSPLLPPRPE